MAMRDAGCAASLLCLLFLCLTVSFQQYEACRTLRGRREGAVTGKLVRMESEEAGAGHSFSLHFHSLSRGTVPPSGPSGCTYIPGSGGSKCLVSEMHLAGDALPLRRHPSGASDARSNILIPVAGGLSIDHEKQS